jgi:hypothetical protein
MLKRLSLLCAVSVVTIVGLEAILRRFPAFNPVPFFVMERPGEYHPDSFMIPDERIGWRLRPSHTSDLHGPAATSNAAGFRGPNELDGLDGPIVAVGDSFTYGTGVTDGETFAAQLEQRLDGVRVANLGIPGFGIDQIALTIRHYALPLKPRLIVVGVVELDFERSLVAYNRGRRFVRPNVTIVDGQIFPRTIEVNPVVRWLDAHGRLWRAGRLAVQGIGHRYPFGSWWTVNAGWLADMHRQGAALGVPVLFVHLPTREGTPFPMLETHFTNLGAPYINLNDEPPRPEWYIPGDLHPSVAGHKRIADRIHRWMQSNGVLPGSR